MEDGFFIKTEFLCCVELGSDKNQLKDVKLFPLGNGSCGQSVAVSFCCSFLLTLFPCYSVGPFHMIQSFTNCSCVGLPQAVVILGKSTCFGMQSSLGCSVDVCSTMALHGLQDNLWSGAWSISSPYALTLVFTWLFLSGCPPEATPTAPHCCQHLGTDTQYNCSVNILMKY